MKDWEKEKERLKDQNMKLKDQNMRLKDQNMRLKAELKAEREKNWTTTKGVEELLTVFNLFLLGVAEKYGETVENTIFLTVPLKKAKELEKYSVASMKKEDSVCFEFRKKCG